MVFDCLCFIIIIRSISVGNILTMGFLFPLKCVKKEFLAGYHYLWGSEFSGISEKECYQTVY